MARNGGFAIIRAGILEHLISGRLGIFELGIYTIVHLQANFETGIWWGSAPRLVATAPAGTNLREVQKALQSLTVIGFLRPFHTQGARGNYPVLIDKYAIRTGALKGMRLNAVRSISWERPCYEVGAEEDAERGAEATPSQYSGSNKQNPVSETHTSSRPSAEVCVPQTQPVELQPEGEQCVQPQPESQRSETSPKFALQPVEPTNESQVGHPEQLPLGQSREEKPIALELLEIYEQERGPLPAVREESAERLSKARRRLLNHTRDQERFLADFRAAVRHASQLPWPTWRPSFDWFVANDTNYAKVLEGNYDRWNGIDQRNRPAPGAVHKPTGKQYPKPIILSNVLRA